MIVDIIVVADKSQKLPTSTICRFIYPASLDNLLLFKYTKELIKPALFQFCHSVKFSRIKPYPLTFRTLIYLYPFVINLRTKDPRPHSPTRTTSLVAQQKPCETFSTSFC
jgi:hypothetical protein